MDEGSKVLESGWDELHLVEGRRTPGERRRPRARLAVSRLIRFWDGFPSQVAGCWTLAAMRHLVDQVMKAGLLLQMQAEDGRGLEGAGVGVSSEYGTHRKLTVTPHS